MPVTVITYSAFADMTDTTAKYLSFYNPGVKAAGGPPLARLSRNAGQRPMTSVSALYGDDLRDIRLVQVDEAVLITNVPDADVIGLLDDLQSKF